MRTERPQEGCPIEFAHTQTWHCFQTPLFASRGTYKSRALASYPRSGATPEGIIICIYSFKTFALASRGPCKSRALASFPRSEATPGGTALCINFVQQNLSSIYFAYRVSRSGKQSCVSTHS